MPRKGHSWKRDVLVDPIYNSKVVTKLINSIMLDGKKGVAQKIVYGAFEQVNTETGKDALDVFKDAMNNVMPTLEVKAKRIGGATYQVPLEVKPDRREALGLRWITQSSRNRGEKTQKERLAKELIRRKKKFIVWQKLTKHLLVSECNIGGKRWEKQENIRLREQEILVSWRTLMLVRLLLPREFCFTQVKHIN